MAEQHAAGNAGIASYFHSQVLGPASQSWSFGQMNSARDTSRPLRALRLSAIAVYLVSAFLFLGGGVPLLLFFAVSPHLDLSTLMGLVLTPSEWPAFYQIFIPVGGVICFIDAVCRFRHVYSRA